jgi:hypothetical protein
MGHQDAFLRPRLSGGCWFSQGTFARTRDNGRDAPKPDLPALGNNPLRPLTLPGDFGR